MKQINIPEPSDLASWMMYLGGISMCLGDALRQELVWPGFWHAGEWTIAFALVYYLAGWWRMGGSRY
jgi:hypothetical protein